MLRKILTLKLSTVKTKDLSQNDQILMRGFTRDIQNIRTGISSYSEKLTMSANPGVRKNLLVSHIYLLNFYMKLMACVTR